MSDKQPFVLSEHTIRDLSANELAYLRKILFVQPETKEALHDWIHLFLDLDLPGTCVDAATNSSPLDMVWETYNAARLNNNPDFHRILFYASRDSYKTVGAAVLEVVMIVLLRRDVAHIAAILDQSRKAKQYSKIFFGQPVIRDFVTGMSERHMEFTHPDGRKVTQELMVMTLQGTNSPHPSFLCVDGATRLFVRDRTGQRQRVTSTARGIFKRLMGVEPSGRTGGETCLEVNQPAQHIEVLSLNMATGQVEWKPILRGHRQLKETVAVEMDDHNSITCTYDHPLYVVGRGFVQARDLTVGDRLLNIGKVISGGAPKRNFLERKTEQRAYVDSSQDDPWDQVVLGSLLGDAGIYKKPTNNPYLREQHAVEQRDYMEWKRSILHDRVRTSDVRCRSGYTGREMCGFITGNSPIFLPYTDFKRTLAGIDRLGALGLAIWYQDDGCKGNGFRLSTESFTEQQNRTLAELLDKKFGLNVAVRSYCRKGRIYYYLSGPVEAKRRLREICSPFIHPTMSYKFDLDLNQGVCRYCGSAFWFYECGTTSRSCGSTICLRLRTGMKMATVTRIGPQSVGWVYDFTVADNYNFFGNSILNHNCLDELDVIRNPEAYTELAFVASPRDGVLPITLLTSSRKWRFGPVQQEIDNAPDTGLLVRHWNILDVTEKCPASRCLPDLPRIPIYRSDLTLKSLSESDFSTLDPDDAKSYVRDSGYVGCLKNCTLFAACRGRLHTHQTCTSNLLKPIVHVQNLFKSASLDKVKAQMLCWKPSTEGLVYTTLEQSIHRKTAGQIAEMIDGVPRPASFRKVDLVAWVAQMVADQALTLKAGIDWGFTHNYVFTLWVVDGQKRSYVVECLMAPGLELDQVVDMTMRLLEPYGGHKHVLCYPDNAYPAYIKTFRRRGFRCQDFKKDVQGGIEAARYAMMDAVGDVRMYFLADDPGIDLLWKHLSQYHWKLDAAGRPTDEPDEENDDGPDTVRYFAQNMYTQSRGVVMSTHQTSQQRFQNSLPAVYPSSYETYLSQIVRDTVAEKGGTAAPSKGRKGSLVFSFGNDDSEVADTISVLKSLGKKPPSQS